MCFFLTLVIEVPINARTSSNAYIVQLLHSLPDPLLLDGMLMCTYFDFGVLCLKRPDARHLFFAEDFPAYEVMKTPPLLHFTRDFSELLELRSQKLCYLGYL